MGDKHADIGTAGRLTYEDSVDVLEKVVEPACQLSGLSVVRADKMSDPGEITEQIFRLLRDSYLVIADVTGANPNVMYELGLRHSTGKATIQIGEHNRLPFDISTIRTIQFRRSEGELIAARKQLSAAIETTLAGTGGDPVTATRIWFESAIVAVSTQDQAPADQDEPGYLEKLVVMTQAIDAATLNLYAIADVIREIASLTDVAFAQAHAGTVDDPAERLVIADMFAARVSEPTSRLEVVVGDYRQSIQRMDPGIRYALTHGSSISNAMNTDSLRLKIVETMLAVDDNLPAIEQYRRVLLETGEATRSLRRVFGRIVAGLDQFLSTRRIFDEWRRLLHTESGESILS